MTSKKLPYLVTVVELARLKELSHQAMAQVLSRRGIRPVTRKSGRGGWALYDRDDALARTVRTRKISPGDRRVGRWK